jgi:hypothetical protein
MAPWYVRALVVVALSAAGCVPSLPFQLELDGVVVDLDAERAALETEICARLDSADCGVLERLAGVVDGGAAGAAVFPPLLPRVLSLPAGVAGVDRGSAATIDVAAWLDQQRQQYQALLVERAMPIVVPAEIKGADASLALGAAAITFGDDRLTVDVPALELWVGDAQGRTFVGVTEAHSAGGAPEAAVHFADGAMDAIVAAFAADEPYFAVRVPDDTPLPLRALDEQSWITPGGSARLGMRFEAAVDVDIRSVRVSLVP